MLPLAVEGRLLAVCDEFESDWKSSKQGNCPAPKIESYLSGVAGDEFDWLLYELIQLEWNYRTEKSQLREDLQKRFPDSGALIEKALTESVLLQTRLLATSTEDTAINLSTQSVGPRMFCEVCDGVVSVEEPEPGTYKCRECSHLFANDRIGKYQRLQQLGDGGFGNVYKAHDPDRDIIVAIKVPKHWESWSNDIKRRFDDEPKYAANLSHDHIVRVTHVDQHDGVPYIVSEYIDGRTLKEVIKEPGTSDLRQSTEWVRQIADALAHAHGSEKPVIHRDIKPGNILIDRDGKAMLTDFGLARQVDKETVHKTNPHQLMGTLPYMAPEQFRTQTADQRSDIYGLGVVLYELLTGRVPFEGDDLDRKVCEDPPASPRRFNSRIPRDLERICLTCLRKERDDRYQSAAALAADLRAHLDGESIRPPRFGPLSKAWRWAKKRPRRAASISVLTVLVAVLATRAAMFWKSFRTFERLVNLETRLNREELEETKRRLAERNQEKPDDPNQGIALPDDLESESVVDLTEFWQQRWPRYRERLLSAISYSQQEIRLKAAELIERFGIAIRNDLEFVEARVRLETDSDVRDVLLRIISNNKHQ